MITSSSGSVYAGQNGVMTLAGSSSIDVNIDAGGTVLNGVMLNDSSTPGLYTAVKKAGSYSTDDLSGKWKINILVSGASAPWWERGELTIYSSGTFTASTVDLFGDDGYLTQIANGALDVSADGLVSLTTFSTLKGVMDSDKSVIVWTDTWTNGTTELAVLTRQANSYSSADLDGTWKFSSLSTGEASSWARGTMTVSSGGSAVVTFETGSSSGISDRMLLISADGTVSIKDMDGADVEGVMDSCKTVMIFTESLGDYGSDMTIFTKQ